MKTSPLPAVAIEPALRAQLDAALEQGESVDEFVEEAVREHVRRRQQAQAAFLARAQASLEEAQRTGEFHTLEQVERELRALADDIVKRHAAQRDPQR
jgi:dsDNA-binding SOS-regulon protein